MPEIHSVESHSSFAARVCLDDIGVLLAGNAASRELTQLLDRYLVLHLIATQPITKPLMGALGFALGFPHERRHQRGGRPGGPPCDTPGFEFIGDYIGKRAASAATPATRTPGYIESLHYDGITLYSMQANFNVPPTTPNLWCDMRDAYRTLPAELQIIADCRCALHAAVPPPPASFADFPPFDAQRARRQPLVIRHPRSQQPALYLPRNSQSRIEGLGAPESTEILERFWQHVSTRAARYASLIGHNELVIWDGLGTTHTNPAYPPGQPRTTWFFSIPAPGKELQPYFG
jgi:hypothetical protein